MYSCDFKRSWFLWTLRKGRWCVSVWIWNLSGMVTYQIFNTPKVNEICKQSGTIFMVKRQKDYPKKCRVTHYLSWNTTFVGDERPCAHSPKMAAWNQNAKWPTFLFSFRRRSLERFHLCRYGRDAEAIAVDRSNRCQQLLFFPIFPKTDTYLFILLKLNGSVLNAIWTAITVVMKKCYCIRKRWLVWPSSTERHAGLVYINRN